MAHTPGPWTAEPQQAGCSVSYRIIAPDGDAIASTDAPHNGREEEANARLIAAAPDLYEALRQIANDSGFGAHARMRGIARAALAKANGEAE